MSQTSKVNSTLRTNIIRSLNVYPKTNAELFRSPVANPWNSSNSRFSVRAIQEATQKLVADGTLTSTGEGKKVFKVAIPSTGAVVAQTLLAAAATITPSI